MNYQISDTYSESNLESERKIMQIESNFGSLQGDLPFRKIESKDSLWKPAPIYGREV